MQHDTATLLKPGTTAWGTLGSAITTPHAMYVLFHVLKMSEWIPQELKFDDCIRKLIENCFTNSNTIVLEDAFAWYVGTEAAAAENQRFLHFFMHSMSWTNQEAHPAWLQGFYFDAKFGLCKFVKEEDLMQTGFVDATQSFHITCQVALLVTPGEYGILSITADVTWRTLLSLWDFQFMPLGVNLDAQSFNQQVMATIHTGKIMLAPFKYFEYIPSLPETPKIPESIPLLFRHDCNLTLYEVEHGMKWSHVRKKLCLNQNEIFDGYGTISPEAHLKHPILLTTSENPPSQTIRFAGLMHHLAEAKFEVIKPPDTDILLLYVTGTVQAMDAFATFWINDDQIQWSARHGRQINLQILETGAYQILYRPKLPCTATTVSVFQKCLFIHMMKTALHVLQQLDGIDWIIKYEQRVLFRGNFPPELSMSLIIPMFEHFFQLRALRGTPAFITMAKRCGDACTLADLLARSKKQNFVLTLMGNPMSGGVGNSNPTAKQDHEKAIEVGVANMYLEYGININTQFQIALVP